MRNALSLVLLAACCAWTQEKAPSGAEKFPDADAKENVTSTCSACHTLVRVTSNRRTAKAWTATIKTHETRGLHLEPEEAAPIVKYLADYFGPMINVNNATAAEFAALPQVDDKLARAVVAYREKTGEFKKIEDLTSVKGFTPALLAKLKNRLEVGKAAQ